MTLGEVVAGIRDQQLVESDAAALRALDAAAAPPSDSESSDDEAAAADFRKAAFAAVDALLLVNYRASTTLKPPMPDSPENLVAANYDPGPEPRGIPTVFRDTVRTRAFRNEFRGDASPGVGELRRSLQTGRSLQKPRGTSSM